MVFKLIQIFLAIVLAASSSSVKTKRPNPAPWDVDYLEPLCPAHVMSAMDDRTWNTINFIWRRIGTPAKNGDFNPFLPLYRGSMGSVCDRLSPTLINSPIFKEFLISYSLIDGLLSKEEGEEWARKIQVNRFDPVMKIGFAIAAMQSKEVGSVMQGTRIFSRNVEGVLHSSKTDSEKFISGILKIAKLLRDAHNNRIGHAKAKVWMFPRSAREDVLALISSVKKSGGDVVSNLERILTERARKLYLEDSDQNTKLSNFTPQGFRIWYVAMKKDNPEGAKKHWKARCEKNWADFKMYGAKHLEEDVRLLDYDEYKVWSQWFAKSRFFSSAREGELRTEFVKSHPYADR